MGDGIAIGLDHRLGQGIECIDLIAIGNGARFRQDRGPGKTVLRQLRRSRGGQRRVRDQSRADKAPDGHEKDGGQDGPQGHIPAVIIGQRMQDRACIGITGLQAGRFQASEKPGHKAQADNEEKERRACHYIWFRPSFRWFCKKCAGNGLVISGR